MAIDLANPKELNLLSDNAFHFKIESLPKFSFFAQTFELPGVSMGQALRATPLVDYPVPGDKVEFNDLQVTFLVDESLENYKEVWKWIMHLGYPQNTREYKNLVTGNSPYIRTSDINLFTLSNKFNVINEVQFMDAFPYALSGIVFNSANTQVDHPVATASFQYSLYRFKGDSTF